MAEGLENVSNRVDELPGEVRVYCIVCGDPEGKTHVYHADSLEVKKVVTRGYSAKKNELAIDIPPTGYADPAYVMHAWLRVGDALCCSERCALAQKGFTEEHDEFHEVMASAVTQEVLTEEQVANMSAPPVEAEFDLGQVKEF